MALRTIDGLDVAGRTVLLRTDLNVPMSAGIVTDATRMDRAVPTIRELASKGARVAVLAHLGRPKGRFVPSLSLEPVAGALAASLGAPVAFVGTGADAASALADVPEGGVALLENLRFDPGEEANDPEYAGRLAALGDAYVNDAFSAAHRAHASTEALARLLPAAAGRLMQEELEALDAALGNPEHPVGALVGGAKVSTKLDLLRNLVTKVDTLIVGGGMANTLLYAEGVDVGASLCERDMAGTARSILAAAREAGCTVALPVDAVAAAALRAGIECETVSLDAVPSDRMILDVGPGSIAAACAILGGLRTLVWNGPLGAFEVPPFDAGTTAVAREAARATREGRLLTVAGGGDTVAALARAGVRDGFSYVSTAGGAFLEWLEGRILPGVAALEAG